MSQNGQILGGIIDRYALIVANGVKDKSRGVITRKRNTKTNTEESAIDFVIISSDLLKSLESITIDEERNNVLTSITNTKKGVIRQESDHNSIITKLNIKWEKKKESERIEVFNFKDKERLEKFKEITENTTQLSSISDSKENIHKERGGTLETTSLC